MKIFRLSLSGRSRRKSTALLLTMLLFTSVTTPSTAAEQRFEFRRRQMGSLVRIVLYAPEEAAQNAAAAAFRRIRDLDVIFSNYRQDGELVNLCRRAGLGPQTISTELFSVLQESVRFSRLSGGIFDVTVGPYVDLWRAAREHGRLPDPTELAHAKTLLGYRKMFLEPANQTARLQQRGMKLDLGGIAKGFIAAEALRVIQDRGIPQALVDAGGDIVVGSPPPGREGWLIAVEGGGSWEKPVVEVPLQNVAIATSGATHRSVEIDGIRYSHIVDPRTGLGLTRSSLVTVVAPDGLTADALATVLSLLPPDEGLELLQSMPEVSALIVGPQGARSQEWATGLFLQFVQE